MQINSASDNTESAPDGNVDGTGTIDLGASGGDAPINGVNAIDIGTVPPIGRIVNTISVDDSPQDLKSAAD